MNLGSDVLGVTISDLLTLIAEYLILIVIIMEGDFFKKKKKQAETAWKKFMKDTKKYWSKKEE